MDRPEAHATRAGKYVVAARLGRWRVVRDESDVDAFPDRDEAVHFACKLAREQAEAGTVAVVVVQSDVHEMHCFTPPGGGQATAPTAKLRLVGGSQ